MFEFHYVGYDRKGKLVTGTYSSDRKTLLAANCAFCRSMRMKRMSLIDFNIEVVYENQARVGTQIV